MAFASLIPWLDMAAESTAGAENVVKEAQEAIKATKGYTAERKEDFERKAHKKLAVQRQIVGLRDKIAKASDSTGADLQKTLNELE